MEGLSLRFDAEAGVVVLTWTDAQPELEEWRSVFERILDDPAFTPDFGIVSDRRRLTRSPTAAFVRGFISIVAASAAAGRFRGRWATVVAPSELAVFGMGRMTEILGEQQTIDYRVFTDLDAALEWASSRS